VRWSVNDTKLVSIGGNDTSVIVWNNFANESVQSENNLNLSSKSTDIVQKNARKGESEDSDTDSEEEGYVYLLILKISLMC
jgi:hypothetical protein